jgi:hypothetical protein
MSAVIFVVSLSMWRLSFIRAAEPCRPVLEELRRSGNEKCYHRRQLCGIPDTESETDSLEGVRVEVESVFHGIVHKHVVSCS